MDMKVLSGKDGVVKVGTNQIGMINSWSINITVGSADITAIGDQWATFKDTIKSWSGSMTGFLKYSDAAQKEIVDQILTSKVTELACEFVANESLTFGGTLLQTGISTSAEVAGVITFTLNFNGQGALENVAAAATA